MMNRNRTEGFKAGRGQALLALFMLSLCVCSCDKARPETDGAAPEAAAELTPAADPALAEEPAQTGDVDTAPDPEAYYRIPLKETPEYHSFIYRYERMRDEQLPLLEASIRQYGLRVDMADSQSLNRAGYGLYEKKDYAGAVRFFREAAYINPVNVYAHYNLACSLSLLRDSIWVDPAAEMDYHHNRHTDYYGIEYKLYETQDNYFNQIDNDQICRNEIFEHLTLACLLDRQYLAKAPIDSDLAGLHTTLRFRRLMKNIQTGKGLEIYGVWYSPQGLMKESYFMLDGSMSHILPNDRPTVQFVKFQYSDYDDDFYDPVIQSRSSSERNFDQIITGYEYFDRGESPKIPNQWEYENSQLIIYSQIINKDYRKLAIIAGADFSPEFDYRYIKDVIKTSDYTKSIPLDNGNKYINIYAVPYRFIMEDDIASLDEWVKIHGIETFDTLAALALIHDHFIVFNWLLSNYKVDKNKLFLFLFLFAKIEFLNHYENGSSVFFDIDKLIMENRDAILNYAAASGNIVFFEHIYAEYYSRIMDALSESEKQEFLTGFWGWSYITSNYMMNKIVRTIHEGKYNGN